LESEHRSMRATTEDTFISSARSQETCSRQPTLKIAYSVAALARY